MKLEKKSMNILMVALITLLLYSLINNGDNFFALVKRIIGYFSVFLIGAVIAFFLNPILEFLEKKLKLSRGKSIVIIYLSLILGLVVFILLVVPKLITNISDLITAFPIYLTRLEEFIVQLLDKYTDKLPYLDSSIVKDQIDKLNDNALAFTQAALKIVVENLVTVTFSVVEFGMAFIFSIFFLGQKEYFKDLAVEVTKVTFKDENANKIMFFGRKLNDVFLSYLHGKTLDSIIIGFIAFVGLSFMKVPYAVFLWLFITFTNFIPYVGPFIGMLVSSIIAFFVYPKKAIIVFGYLLAVQQFDAWFLEPRIVGNKLNLKMIWTISAVTVGGSLAGPLGIVLASPMAGLIKEFYVLKKNRVLKNEDK